MRNQFLFAARCATAAVCFAIFLAPATLLADPSDVISVEEHWELEVGGPDMNRSAPQVTMVMSPFGHLYCDYFIFEVNHWSHPEFAAGGTQVQHWHAEETIDSRNGPNYGTLCHEDETVAWVQRLSLSDGQLTYEIVDGTSQTWGNFGGQGYLRSTTQTSLSRLNDYRPGISISESGIAYAGNRVASLTLTKLKWTTADGQTHEMIAPIDIDADLDP